VKKRMTRRAWGIFGSGGVGVFAGGGRGAGHLGSVGDDAFEDGEIFLETPAADCCQPDERLRAVAARAFPDFDEGGFFEKL
jgi:hypothetical protein